MGESLVTMTELVKDEKFQKGKFAVYETEQTKDGKPLYKVRQMYPDEEKTPDMYATFQIIGDDKQ